MIRFIEGHIVITSKKKPEKGDLMACFSTGILNRETGEYIGRGWRLSKHDGSPISRLNAICNGTEKVIFKL